MKVEYRITHIPTNTIVLSYIGFYKHDKFDCITSDPDSFNVLGAYAKTAYEAWVKSGFTIQTPVNRKVHSKAFCFEYIEIKEEPKMSNERRITTKPKQKESDDEPYIKPVYIGGNDVEYDTELEAIESILLQQYNVNEIQLEEGSDFWRLIKRYQKLKSK